MQKCPKKITFGEGILRKVKFLLGIGEDSWMIGAELGHLSLSDAIIFCRISDITRLSAFGPPSENDNKGRADLFADDLDNWERHGKTVFRTCYRAG